MTNKQIKAIAVFDDVIKGTVTFTENFSNNEMMGLV
jgi:hypothetical protein